MNQLISLENMSIEDVKNLQTKLMQRELTLLGGKVETIEHNLKESKFEFTEHKKTLRKLKKIQIILKQTCPFIQNKPNKLGT